MRFPKNIESRIALESQKVALDAGSVSTGSVNTSPAKPEENGDLVSKIIDIGVRLAAGDINALKELNELGIKYQMKTLENGKFQITFNYNGNNYEFLYIPVSSSSSEPEPEPKPGNRTKLDMDVMFRPGLDLENYIKYPLEGVNLELMHPINLNDEKYPGRTGEISTENFELTNKPLPEGSYIEGVLRGKYSFSAEIVDKYFVLEDYKRDNNKVYTIKPGIVLDGKAIKTVEELNAVLTNEEEVLKKPPYNFSDAELKQYFTSPRKGEYTIKAGIIIDGKEVNTPKELRAALDDLKAKTTAATPTTPQESAYPTYKDLESFVRSSDAENAVKSKIGGAFKSGLEYSKIANSVLAKHTNDYTTLTRQQILDELVHEYNAQLATITSKDENVISGATELKTFLTRLNGVFLDDIIDGHNKINTNFSLNANGELVFSDSNAKAVYNKIFDILESDVSVSRYYECIEKLGGKAVLKSLIKAAWLDIVAAYDSANVNTESFVKSVIKRLEMMLNNVINNPDNLQYFASGTEHEQYYGYGNATTKINYNYVGTYPEVAEDGRVHLDDDASDKEWQKAMDDLLENVIYKKYPNISKSVLKTLFKRAQIDTLYSLKYYRNHLPQGINGNLNDLTKAVCYEFDKALRSHLLLGLEVQADEPTTPTTQPQPEVDTAKNDKIKSAAESIMPWVEDVSDDIVSNCYTAIGGKNSIHTEFGMANGKIVFQEADTTKVYNTILDKLKAKLGRFASEALAKLGGNNVLEQLLQAAWITTYNNFNSSTSNNLTNFVNKVMENLMKMFKKLQSNPELLEVFTQRSSYADSKLTKDLNHYYDTSAINYGGNVTTYHDGSVHISNTSDDSKYQGTMIALLERLKNKYSSVDSKIIESVFRNAQREALSKLQNNIFDCPYGTGNNSSRVEDTTKNWGGKDNRKGDKSKISMRELVQMTLYCFDRLFYAEMLK